MTIAFIQGYKVLEEETLSPSVANVRVRTLLFDLSQDLQLTAHLASKLEPLLYDAEKISFISAYAAQITPSNFSGLAVVKWLPLDGSSEEISDYCYPLFVANRNQDNTHLTEILEGYIYQKAQSQQYLTEFTKELFDE